MSEETPSQEPDSTNRELLTLRIWGETKGWFSFFSFCMSTFFLFATITNFLYGSFDLRLLPLFANSLEEFRRFAHMLLDYGLYRWIEWLCERLWYVVLLIVSLFTGASPRVPELNLPLWFLDAALISTVFLRAQSRAMRLSNPVSTLEMSEAERDDWNGAIVSTPRALRFLIEGVWQIVLILYLPASYTKRVARVVVGNWAADVTRIFVGGAFMLGFAYLVHDFLISAATLHVSNGAIRAHRRFMLWMALSIIAASAASIGFFILNGYLLDDV